MQPLDFYAPCDSTACKLSEVRDKIAEIQRLAASRNLAIFWRGQRDHTWGMTSSLVRMLVKLGACDDAILDAVEERLLADAAQWIQELQQAPYLEPLARLAYMQHYGVPTRLIDFTTDPWTAVFFAAESDDHVDGRMFALLVEPGDTIGATPLGRPWTTYPTNEVKVWDPVPAGITFPRLIHQRGVLAVGRLPSTRPHRIARDLEAPRGLRSLLAEEVRRILSIPFKLSRLGPKPSKAQAPIGFTFRIHVDKASVRRDLAGGGAMRRISPPGTSITHRDVYPDVDGLVRNSAFLRGLASGVLVLK